MPPSCYGLPSMSAPKTPSEAIDERSCATIVEPAAATPNVRAFGLNADERLRRSLSSCGLRIIASADIGNLDSDTERVIALRASHFYDHRLIAELAENSAPLLLVAANDGGEEPVSVGMVGSPDQLERILPVLRSGEYSAETAAAAGLEIAYATDIVRPYDAKLRRNTPPFVLPAVPERALEVQNRIFDASYKGVTDFVTKWIWPLPARIVTHWCARFGVAPNTVTAVSYVLTFLTLFAFWQGELTIGLVSAWLMTFLDTVDGKLARVTLTSSKIGDILDHGLDLIHPPFWWAAWAAGMTGPTTLFGDYAVWVAIVCGGYVVGRLLEGLFMIAFDQEMFVWRPFDLKFRLFIARRNPNLVLLTAATILGRPDLGFMAVGIWTLACIGIQCVRLGQAAALRMRGQDILPYAD